MRTKLKGTALIVALILLGLQSTGPAHTNPPFDEAKTLAALTAIPAEVAGIFARSCNDCHSNKTHWRWYTYVAPISWLTVGHVNDGRSELNFSEWGSYGARKKETRLRAICKLCEQGTMPPASYALVHRDVRLTRDQVRAICEWTAKESQRLTTK